ncbi:hypothetical protein [Acidovorax facilis]|uniref:hypothetical protein n=1 Tax=Acidovorax facilis TaxID=12917 RepID=UPI003D64E616
MSKNDLVAAAEGTATVRSDWDVRGHLAASLTCWHRLTGKEADELVAMFQGHSAPATQQAGALSEKHIKEHGDKASRMMARDMTRFDAACEVDKYLRDQGAPMYYRHRMSIVLFGNTEGTDAARAPDNALQTSPTAQAAIMPKGESAAARLRAMATNYPDGHRWDKLDAKTCIKGALEIEALRAACFQAGCGQRDALPTIKGASITGGYVVVTPSGWGDDKAAVLRDAILRTFPVNPAFSPKPDDAALATKGGA